jgi:hypothetical protein
MSSDVAHAARGLIVTPFEIVILLLIFVFTGNVTDVVLRWRAISRRYRPRPPAKDPELPPVTKGSSR